MMNPVLDTEGLAKYHQLLKSKELGAKANKSAGVFYIEGTGDTAGVWLGAHSDITEYYPGLMIAYKPSIAGATGLTLNINNLGAVAVVRNTTTAVTTHYDVGSILMLGYTVDSDGTAYWKIADYDSDTKTRSSNKTGSKMYIIGATTQSTSGQTTYSNSNCYIGTDNCLYSGGKKVLDVEGTAASATKLATARTIALSGDATGSAKFDGSGDVTLDVTVSGGGGSGDAIPKTGDRGLLVGYNRCEIIYVFDEDVEVTVNAESPDDIVIFQEGSGRIGLTFEDGTGETYIKNIFLMADPSSISVVFGDSVLVDTFFMNGYVNDLGLAEVNQIVVTSYALEEGDVGGGIVLVSNKVIM